MMPDDFLLTSTQQTFPEHLLSEMKRQARDTQRRMSDVGCLAGIF